MRKLAETAKTSSQTADQQAAISPQPCLCSRTRRLSFRRQEISVALNQKNPRG